MKLKIYFQILSVTSGVRDGKQHVIYPADASIENTPGMSQIHRESTPYFDILVFARTHYVEASREASLHYTMKLVASDTLF